MILVHISGSPGSGKTTLGKRFSQVSGIVVIDTDDLFTEDDALVCKKLEDQGDLQGAKNYWKNVITTRLIQAKEYNTTAKVLVFTGILNHGNSDSSILCMPFEEIEKYFLDVPAPQLLTQFYGRLARLLVEDSSFAEDVANNKWTVEGSKEFLEQSAREKEWHILNGYRLLIGDRIEWCILRHIP